MENQFYQSSLELRGYLDDVRDALNETIENGKTWVHGAEDRWIHWSTIEQHESQILDLQNRIDEAEALEYEAIRSNVSPEELLAFKNGDCTYLPDYDDHSSDDPRCEQNILCELGMSILIAPRFIKEPN